MLLRSFFILCLFYIFGGCSSILAMDPLTEHYCQRLNKQAGSRTHYSADHFYYMQGTFPKSEDFSDIKDGSPRSYRVRGVLLNGTPLLSRVDGDGKISWHYTPYDAPDGNPLPFSAVIGDGSILENFSRSTFLAPRKRLLSQEEWTILERNPDVYIEQEGKDYFLHDPFQFDVYLGEELIRISAREVSCFFTAHAPSLEAYRANMHPSQNTISFRSELSSHQYGSITLDMEAVFDEHISKMPETVFYALNHTTHTVDVFVLTHFPPPFRNQYVRIVQGINLDAPQRPSPIARISEPPPMVHAEEDDDEAEDSDDSFVEVNLDEDSPEEIPPQPEAREETTEPLAPPFPDHQEANLVNLNPFNSEVSPSPIPGLFHFSYHSRSQAEHEKETTLYYETLDNLRVLLSSIRPEDRELREKLLHDIKVAVSRRIFQESSLFDCRLLASRKALVTEEEGRPLIKGKTRLKEERRYFPEETWKRKWEPQEGDPTFNQFLERCCVWLSANSYTSLRETRNKHIVQFDREIPPSGEYVERHTGGGVVLWEPHPPSDHPPYRVIYETRLFFDEDNAEELESFLLREGSLSVHSLIIHYVEMTPQRQRALLKILKNAPSLRHLALSGCVFKLGMFSALQDALQNHSFLETVELSQNEFPEIHAPSESLDETVRMFTRELYSLRRLTLSERYGVSLHWSPETARTPRAPFLTHLTLTSHNTDVLWTLPEERLHTDITSLFMENVHRGRFYPIFTRGILSRLIASLSQWRHVKHLRLIKGFEDGALPLEFFTCGLVGFTDLHTLNLSNTKLAVHEGSYEHLRTLSQNCPGLRTLILAGSFNSPLEPRALLPALKDLMLYELDLSFNQLSLQEDDPAAFIPFTHLPFTLRTLRMSGCFRDRVPLYLVEILVKSPNNLTHLDVSESPFNMLRTADDRARYAEFIGFIQDLTRPTLTLHVGYEFPSPSSPQLPRQSIPLYLEHGSSGGNALCVTPFNIKLFPKFLFKPPLDVKEIEFQDLEFEGDQFELVHSVLLNKFPHLETMRMRKCFTGWEEFLEASKIVRTLRRLRTWDISENPFHHFSSYGDLRAHIRELFQADPTLETVIFTGQEGERIEWTQRLFIKEPPQEARAAAAATPSKGLPPPHAVRRFFIHPALKESVAFSGDIRFLGYTENLLFLRRIFIQNVSLNSIGLSVLENLRALRHLHSLALRNCFEDMPPEQLPPFFETLGTLNLKKLDISGHVFHHDEYEAVVPLLVRSSTLEELSLCIPRRENKVVKRGVIGTIVSGTAAVGGGVLVTYLTGGIGTVPYVAAVSGSGATGGGLSAASGYIANALKGNKTSEQCVTALMPFTRSNIRIINGYNVKRKPKGLKATQDYLRRASAGKIEFRLFREISS